MALSATKGTPVPPATRPNERPALRSERRPTSPSRRRAFGVREPALAAIGVARFEHESEGESAVTRNDVPPR
jgi:hypothetical protein